MSSKDNTPKLGVIEGNPNIGVFDPFKFKLTKFKNEDGRNYNQILILNMHSIDGGKLKSLLEIAEPSVIIDIRYSPTFDSGFLSRQKFFNLIKNWNALYLDVYGLLQQDRIEHQPSDFTTLFKEITKLIEKSEFAIPGGILILADNRNFSVELYSAAGEMSHPNKKTWSIETYPDLNENKYIKSSHSIVKPINQTDTENAKYRQTIFISHANPNDNDFALWLSTKLQSIGYMTWVDIKNLRAGNTFWDEISNIIKNQAAKVIFIQSATSLNKPNVLNEVDLALSVERRRAMYDFVIPIRIDKSSFDDTYIGLRRKLILDFSDNWANGLTSLLEKLEGDDVPKTVSNITFEINNWFQGGKIVIQEIDKYLSNWYEIVSLPRKVNWWVKASIPEDVINNNPDKLVVEKGIVFSFSGEFNGLCQESSELKCLNKGYLETDALLHNIEINSIFFKKFISHRILHRLIKQSWDEKMKSLGLIPYQLSGYRTCWYWPIDILKDEEVKFTDIFGEKRSRKLIGQSRKYNSFWNFAVEIIPEFGRFKRIVFRPHVIFTKDGREPIESHAVMHRLRRSFCKNWWNSRWRDLLGAYLKLLSVDSKIELDTGAKPILIDAYPVVFVSQVKPTSDAGIAIEYPAEDETDDDDFDIESEYITE